MDRVSSKAESINYKASSKEESFHEKMLLAKAKGEGFKDIAFNPPAYGRPPCPEPYAFTHSVASSDPDDGQVSFSRKSTKGRD